METNIIHTGDALAVLKTLPDESVHCVVTSPPYWGLRDYGVCGQIGLEDSPFEFIQKITEVFREVRRVLWPEGTCWINLGDTYATGAGKQGDRGRGEDNWQSYANECCPYQEPNRMPIEGLKPKDLIGIPWRVAFALQEDGWFLRQDIIWSKPNPMPESVRDRCTKSHEYLFLLSKSRRYYFDDQAIREPMICGFTPTGVGFGHGYDDVQKPRYKVPSGWDQEGGSHGRFNRNNPKGNRKTFRGGGAYTNGQSYENGAEVENDSVGNAPNESGTRNKRSVWEVATYPYKAAHFATFPPRLVEPCILAGCPEGGTVLDPFMGSGTVAIVALNHFRKYVGIELNPEYVALANERILSEGNHTRNLFDKEVA